MTTLPAPFVLTISVVAIAIAATLILRPMLATILVVFLLYLNVPAILTQRYGIAEPYAGALILLAIVPVAAHSVLRRQQLKWGDVFALMALFLATLMLSTTAAIDRVIAIGRVQGFIVEGLLLYWLIVNAVRDLPTLRAVMFAMLAAGTLVSTLSGYQEVTASYSSNFGGLAYRNFDEQRDSEAVRIGGRGHFSRANGPVNEPNRFAQIMIVLLPFAFYLHRTARSRAARLAAAAMGAAVLGGVVLTLSRGAFVGLALMAAGAIAAGWIRLSRVTIATVAAAVVLPIVAPAYVERLGSIGNVSALAAGDDARAADGAIRGRATEMLAALHVFVDHPIIGVGPGQFAQFYVQDYSRNPDIQFRDLVSSRRAHSLYLELAAEHGAIGLAVFLAIVGVLLARLWHARAVYAVSAPAAADLAAACALSLLAYLSTGMFLHLSYQRYYWLLIAVCATALHQMPPVHPRRSSVEQLFART